MAEGKRTPGRSGKATASLFFGLLFLVAPVSILALALNKATPPDIIGFGLLGFGPLVSVLAVVLGHIALSSIRKSVGRLGGRQFAVTGLVFGYLGVLWTILLGTMSVYYRLHPPFEGWAPAAGLRTISSAANVYAATYSNGYPPSLEALGPAGYKDWPSNTLSCDHAGLIDQDQANGLKGGYKFTYVAQMPDQAKWTPSAEAKKHGCTVAGVSTFTATAEPASQATENLPSYFVDETGVIRVEQNGPASVDSPALDESQRF